MYLRNIFMYILYIDLKIYRFSPTYIMETQTFILDAINRLTALVYGIRNDTTIQSFVVFLKEI